MNGDQNEGNYSNFRYRPFTLEGNFAFAAGLQEMLLQSHTGIIEIFPAIPDDWDDVHFDDLRAQGAFLVSASKKDGQVEEVRIQSEKGGHLQILNPFKTGTISVLKRNTSDDSYEETDTYEWKDDILQMDLSQNEEIKLISNTE